MHSEMFNDPKEIKVGKLKWLDRHIYNGIGNLQADLNDNERSMLVEQLATSLKCYETLALSMQLVRQELYRMYTEAIIEKRATSCFSRNFNMSVKGLNKQIGKQIDTAFKTAFEHEKAGRTLDAALTLQFADINHRILFSDRIASIIQNANNEAYTELIRIDQYREKLFLSVLKMTAGIARKHNKRIEGSIIEWSDLVQEALIAAICAVEGYHPIADGKTFTSYIYTYVNGIINKKVNEATKNMNVLSLEEPSIVLNQDFEEAQLSTAYLSLEDTIKDDSLGLEERMDGMYLGPKLMNIVRQFANEEEYTIMELRYGSGPVPGYMTVAEQYSEMTGKPMNKGKVALIEQTVLGRLQEAMQEDPILTKSLKELRESLEFVDLEG